MQIQHKLKFLKSYIQQPYFQYSQQSITNSNLLKSCFQQINSFNQTISQQFPFTSELYKNSSHSRLPAISKQFTKSSQNFTTKALINKACLLLQKQKKTVTIQNQASRNTSANHKNSQIQKEKKIRVRIVHQPKIFLRKDQRYFQLKEVQVLSQNVKKLGLYESTNIYKAKNIKQQLNQLTIVAEKPEFNPIKLINKNDLFLTNIAIADNRFNLQSFIEDQLQRDKQCEKVVAKCESIRNSKKSNLSDLKPLLKQRQIEVTPIYITFKNYRVLQDEQYNLLKIKYLQNWGNMLLNLRCICSCLQQHKIMHLVVKQNKLFFWEGQKTQKKQIEGILTLPSQTVSQKIYRLLIAFRDKLKVTIMKRTLQRKQNLARWVIQRLKTVINLRKDKTYKIQKAISLQNKWANEHYFAQIQIRIPSFSVQLFKRNTTQYMQSFQALYHSLWESTETPLVLVLQTINENLLKMLQTRIKITRPITIITPEIHQVFPKNLPLTSQINFSYETLKKVQKAIAGKEAVLYGGIYDDPTQQLLLSQYLNVPFCGSLNKNTISQQKKFFTKVGLKNNPFCIIQPNSTFQDLLEQLSSFFMVNSRDKHWIFKINNEFRGRGIATFSFLPSKHFACPTKQINKLTLKQNLRSMLRLKLKINFQNSLFMVQDYLTIFLQKGGVVQQLSDISNTYEICFRKEANCELLSIFKVFGINFANKVWLSTQLSIQLTPIVVKIQAEIQRNNFLGYLSITLSKCTNNQFLGIDLKFGQTPVSNITSYIKMVERKRLGSLNSEAIDLVELPTKRTQKEEIQNQQISLLNSQSFRYLFVPTIPFTDINQTTKSLLIQQLMNNCWTKRKLKITDEDFFYFSLGLDFSALVVSKQMKKLKKIGIELVRQLADKTSSLKQYRGKQVVRDVFQYGDVIRAISQIKNDD